MFHNELCFFEGVLMICANILAMIGFPCAQHGALFIAGGT